MSALTDELVDRFAIVMKEKLEAADKKYGHGDSWLLPDWEEKCRVDLMEHVLKGDPRDVAIYAAFCWHHNWKTFQ